MNYVNCLDTYSDLAKQGLAVVAVMLAGMRNAAGSGSKKARTRRTVDHLASAKIEASDLVSNLNVIESVELSSAQVRRLLPPPCLPPAPQPPLPVPPPFPPPAPHDQGTGRILKLSQLNKQMQKHQREKRHNDNKNGMKSRLTKSCHPAEVLAVSAQLKSRCQQGAQIGQKPPGEPEVFGGSS